MNATPAAHKYLRSDLSSNLFGFTTEYALYNLRRDPGEEYNVKELYPEIVKELENLAEIARNDLGDDLNKRIGNNIREPGRID